jgi:hypothetical protein
MARSMRAFLNAMEAALTASPVIGPVTNWSISSFEIFGSAALLAAMAAFFNFVLLGINGPVDHGYASNTKFRTGSEWALVWMLSPVGRHEIEQVSASTSGLHTLSVGKVSRLPISVPSLEEQSRIVAEVDRQLSILRGVETAVNANLRRVQTLRGAVLAKSFGEV